MDDGRRKYLTVREVAGYFGISGRTAYDLISRGDLAAKKFGRSVRVSKDEPQRYERGSDWRARHDGPRTRQERRAHGQKRETHRITRIYREDPEACAEGVVRPPSSRDQSGKVS